MDGDTAIRFLLSSLPSKKGPMVGSFASTNRTFLLYLSIALITRPYELSMLAVPPPPSALRSLERRDTLERTPQLIDERWLPLPL